MKWLTVDYIKQHSRICGSCEDGLLELYGESAEETVLNMLNRSFDDLKDTFGTEASIVPAPVVHASLMLVDLSYQQRSPVGVGNLSVVPYTFDTLIKPYMKL